MDRIEVKKNIIVISIILVVLLQVSSVFAWYPPPDTDKEFVPESVMVAKSEFRTVGYGIELFSYDSADDVPQIRMDKSNASDYAQLHDLFNGVDNHGDDSPVTLDDVQVNSEILKRVWIENISDYTLVAARIRLDEYMQIGNYPLIEGTDPNDTSTWNNLNHSDRGTPFSNIWRIAYGANVITMAEYKTIGNPEGFEGWVFDKTEGYYYWSQLLAPGEVTGNLIERAMLMTEIEDESYYAINVTAEVCRVPMTIEISGEKTWDAPDNIVLPDNITVNLKNGDTIVDTKIVTAEDKWKYTFTVRKYDEEGKEIVYTVDEEPIKGYIITVDGYNITNKYTPTNNGGSSYGGGSSPDNKPSTEEPSEELEPSTEAPAEEELAPPEELPIDEISAEEEFSEEEFLIAGISDKENNDIYPNTGYDDNTIFLLTCALFSGLVIFLMCRKREIVMK